MPTTHGKQHPPSTADDFLEAIKMFWKIAHPWRDSNPWSPGYMLSVYMCINAYTCIFLWVPWHHYIHFCQCTHKIGQTFKADPKKYNFMRNYTCHKKTPIRKGSFTVCLPIFLDSAYVKTPIYQIWYFPPEVKISATFCHISATLGVKRMEYCIAKLQILKHPCPICFFRKTI